MEWTKVQSKTWQYRKDAWHSSFIRLIEEINSGLCVPWRPLAPFIEVCMVSLPHFVILELEEFKTWGYEAKKPMHQREFYSKNGSESQSLDAVPLLQYLSDLLEGSVALWNRKAPLLRRRRLCFSGFSLSLDFMQCLVYLLLLSITVPISLYLH